MQILSKKKLLFYNAFYRLEREHISRKGVCSSKCYWICIFNFVFINKNLSSFQCESWVRHNLFTQNHETKQCFGLWFKLLLLVISYKCSLSKGDVLGAVHILNYRRSVSLLLVLFSNASAIVSPICSSAGKYHGCFCCKKKKTGSSYGFICLGNFKNTFYSYYWGRWYFSSDCFLWLQKDKHSASTHTSCHPCDFLWRSPPWSSVSGMVGASAPTLDKINWIILNNVNRWCGLDRLILPGVN